MNLAIINDRVVIYDKDKKKWIYKLSKQPLDEKAMKELNAKIAKQKAEDEAKPILAVCLGNFGVPAKTRFFKPVAGPENKKVWPPHEKENRKSLFVLAKDEQYMVHPRIMNNPKAKTMFKAVKGG
jgi:hypothetical protein